MALDQINEALTLFERLQNETSISDHVIANLETILSTPLTPLASNWDSFAGDYFSNAEGNGLFYAVLTWTGIYSLYEKFMHIALQRSPWTSHRKFEIVEAFWYITVHIILLLASLWMVDPGYVADILTLDIWSFSWRLVMHSVRVVPRNVMLVFMACSAFQIFSALRQIMQEKNKSALQKGFAAGSFIVLYSFRKIQLLLLANASLCFYGAVCEILRAYQVMTVAPVMRQKVTRTPGRNTQLGTNNKQQLQTLYDTVKGALIIKRSIRRHQERRKTEKSDLEEDEGSTIAITEFSGNANQLREVEIAENEIDTENSDTSSDDQNASP